MFGFSANRTQFESDPFGYSSQAFLKWNMLSSLYKNLDFDPYEKPTYEMLKNPVLWLSQAEALSQAATVIIKSEPQFDNLPLEIRGICDSQFCAVGLMLAGYSLEVALKAMMVISLGIDEYQRIESKKRHHRLHELSQFIPNLTPRDTAILRGLTHFVYWAGRYPDPGSGREDDVVDIFEISEKHEISIKDLFSVITKIMTYANEIIQKNS